jgi:HTH-type transcriptional regulator/antitoxin HipB
MRLRGAVLEAQALGNRIREAREAQGLRQDELAFAAGISRRLLQQVEHGKPTARYDSLLKILGVLGLTLEVTPRTLRRIEGGDVDDDMRDNE